jgi:hypothetical protein
MSEVPIVDDVPIDRVASDLTIGPLRTFAKDGGSPAVQSRERFDWLREPRNRRGNLRDVRRAVIAGWIIDPDARADLVRVIEELVGSGELTDREMIKVVWVLVSMTKADQRAAQRSPNPPRTEGVDGASALHRESSTEALP